MARIPYVDLAAAPEKVREALEALPVKLNVFRMVANASTLFRPWSRLGGAILGRMQLAPRLRELIILRVARRSSCNYEWTQHVGIAKACGIDQAQIDALAAGHADAPGFDDADRLIVRAVDEAIDQVRLPEATFAALAARFSHQEIVEVLMTVGFYRGLAMVIESTGVDLDPPTGTAIVDDLTRRMAGRS
jgi:alkylhydroperoxidase family enzyme